MKKEIIEGNCLIAEFMGYDPQRIVSEMPVNKDGNYCDGVGDLDEHGNPCYVVYAPSLQYDSSWNHLMPVLQKIALRDYNGKGDLLFNQIKHHLLKFEGIVYVWIAVVEFIKWYNSKN